MLSFAGPVLLYAEEIDATTGQHIGNFPQACTHLALVEALTRLVEMEETESKEGSASVTADLRARPPQSRYKIAIGLTGEPVATASGSGAITHRNDHCLNSAHIGARTEKSR